MAVEIDFINNWKNYPLVRWETFVALTSYNSSKKLQDLSSTYKIFSMLLQSKGGLMQYPQSHSPNMCQRQCSHLHL